MDPGLWNTLIPRENIIARWEHLAAVEASGINDCVYQYTLFYEGENPGGCASYYYISFDLDIFNKGLAKKITLFIQKHLFPRFMKMRVIECGAPTALGRTVNWKDGADYREIFRLLVGEMTSFARSKKVNILIFRDFIIKEKIIHSVLSSLAFRKVDMLPGTEMVNYWTDFSQYEMDLKRHHRYIVRRYIRTLTEQNVTIRVLSDFAHLAPRLQHLWQECFDRALEYQREKLSQAYFREISIRMQGKSKLIVFEKNQEVIGFLLGMHDEDRFQALYAGMDYRYVRDTFMIFNIYLATIRLGIDLGVRVIENGITTLREKMNFGFKPIPFAAYMRHLSPVLNPVLSRVFSLFSESTRFENWTVFNQRYSERVFGDIKATLSVGKKEFLCTLINLTDTGAMLEGVDRVQRGKILLYLEYPFENETIKTSAWTSGSIKHGDMFMTDVHFDEIDRYYSSILLEKITKRAGNWHE